MIPTDYSYYQYVHLNHNNKTGDILDISLFCYKEIAFGIGSAE